MSHQCLADALVSWEARYAAEVAKDTWGHLAPRKNKTYRGHIVFAAGCFGSDDLNPTALRCEFKGLDSSPWFFDAMADFLASLEVEAGEVYCFEGTFRNYEFSGTVRPVALVGIPESPS